MANDPSHQPDQLFRDFQQALAGRYSLEREIGRGGMGIVYLARDVRLDRPVALKLLPPGLARSPALRERFLREARMAARLGHPNIVPIHSVEEAGRFVFFAMAFVDGETLGDRIRRQGRLAPREAARILREVAWALGYAHAQRVIHRDIKPENILLERGTDRVLVADFGIAKAADCEPDGAAPPGDGGDTSPGLGTPHYMSPEQALGAPLDGRSDIYSLGAVGFHVLTGRPPFQGAWVKDVLQQHLSHPAPPVASLAPDVPAALAEAIDRALAKRPEDRHPTAEAMAEALVPRSLPSLDLPVPLRIWVEKGRELKSVYMLWSLYFFGIGIMVYVANAGMGGARTLRGLGYLLGFLFTATLPWAGHLLWRIGETRKVLRAGATLDDLRWALAVHQARRAEELAYEGSRPIHWIPRLVRIGTYVSVGTAMAALLGGVFVSKSFTMSRMFFQVFGLGAMGTVTGGLFGLVFPGRRVRPHDAWAALRKWYYGTSFGTLMTRLAGFGLEPTPSQALGLNRPTEIALGSAATALWGGLPAAQRAMLEGLPQVVERLEREARLARDQLNRGQGNGLWASRLAGAVAALETLRVGLLRLKAGEVDAGSLTEDLAAARELSDRVDRLLEARDEVNRMLGNAQPSTTPVG